ncbi:hypothetical protein PoB_005550100 [Plakobranchus ocellatus]|uniref:Uncharacterized protein n=1 Tax=Plakobranchus ocellatus TaxID=259542 RepID=A0AAV4CCB4_9GAST|nr:hypothetical protein PoB_005550100 [Plakobranchus ocellatus]
MVAEHNALTKETLTQTGPRRSIDEASSVGTEALTKTLAELVSSVRRIEETIISRPRPSTVETSGACTKCDAFITHLIEEHDDLTDETSKENSGRAIQVNAPANFNIQRPTNIAIGGDIHIQGQQHHQGHVEGNDEESTEEATAKQESDDDV